MRIDVITIFPEYLRPLGQALVGKAIEQGRLEVYLHNLRDWATGVHQAVDDSPYGGGPGMVMSPTVWGPALDDVAQGRAGASVASFEPHRGAARHDELAGEVPAAAGPGEKAPPLLVVPTPSGEPFTQAMAQEFAREERLVFACGRYEGIDQRVFEDARARYRVREVSIGDYVLVGGEVAVLVMAEAAVRLIPGVLGNHRSHEEDSFSDGLLEGPCYTKPRSWRGLEVPEVLASGNHAAIERWHHEQALARTLQRRPELLEKAELSQADREFLQELRPRVTQLDVLAVPAQWRGVVNELSEKLAEVGVLGARVESHENAFACEPDNVLVAEYEQREEHPPVAESLFHFEISARSALDPREVTQAVVGLLPEGATWYGTTVESEEG